MRNDNWGEMWVIYNIKRKDCDAEDIGETATKLGT